MLKNLNSRYLDNLTAEEHSRFVYNLGGITHLVEYLESREYEDGYTFICDAFDWARTQLDEGVDYWNDIATRLKSFSVDYCTETDKANNIIIQKLNQQLNDLSQENQELKVALKKAILHNTLMIQRK
jgi:hypothetical protein